MSSSMLNFDLEIRCSKSLKRKRRTVGIAGFVRNRKTIWRRFVPCELVAYASGSCFQEAASNRESDGPVVAADENSLACPIIRRRTEDL